MSEKNYISNVEAPGPVDWAEIACDLVSQNKRCVLIFVTSHEGSTPRETGAWALVSDDVCHGTLGGGEVEHLAMADARELLSGQKQWQRTSEKFHLGPDLGQCCGGVMDAFFEPVNVNSLSWLKQVVDVDGAGYILFPLSEPPSAPQVMAGVVPENLAETAGLHIQPLMDDRPKVVLYGAGHIGRSIAVMAAQMPVRLEVVDERPEALENISPARNIKVTQRESPPAHAKELEDADAVLIMTHNHGLDYRLCQMLIGKIDIAYLGLIGSASKAARFRNGLAKEGFCDREIEHLTCPIGRYGPLGKEPGVIALSALTEIMQILRSGQIGDTNHEANKKSIERQP
jgi:xanthine dehydrogenase accessory factor